jgi:hypothetical protein
LLAGITDYVLGGIYYPQPCAEPAKKTGAAAPVIEEWIMLAD